MTTLPAAQYVRPVERPLGVPRVRLSKKPPAFFDSLK